MIDRADGTSEQMIYMKDTRTDNRSNRRDIRTDDIPEGHQDR